MIALDRRVPRVKQFGRLAALLLASLWLLWLLCPAAPAAADPAPRVIIAGDVTGYVSGAAQRLVTGRVLLVDDLAVPATLRLTAVFPDGDAAVTADGRRTVSLAAHTSRSVAVAFVLPSVTDVSGRLAADVVGDRVAVAAISVVRSPTGADLWLAVGAAAAAAALLVAAAVLFLRRPDSVGFGGIVGAGSQWSFTSSWAQNVTALGAVLTTLFAASGFLATELPGVSTGGFVGLSLVSFGAVATAPLVLYNQPRAWRFVIAAGITVFGAAVELATLLLIVMYSAADTLQRDFLLALLAVAGLALAVYTEETMRSVLSRDTWPLPANHTPLRGRPPGADVHAGRPPAATGVEAKARHLVNLL